MLLLITTSLVTDELIKLALLACLASYLRFSPQKWKSYPPSSVRCKFFYPPRPILSKHYYRGESSTVSAQNNFESVIIQIILSVSLLLLT